MASEFITRVEREKDEPYTVIFKTDDVDKYKQIEDECRKMIGHAKPTVDAVPVCHAFWYWKDETDWNIGAWRCSACHNRPNTIWETEKNLRPRRLSGSAYCSNCGAKMDGADGERRSDEQ
jgi:hypothetical protein